MIDGAGESQPGTSRAQAHKRLLLGVHKNHPQKKGRSRAS
jgi:hypothetical protein